MKQRITLIGICILFVTALSAQEDSKTEKPVAHKSTICLNIGESLVGNLIGSLNNAANLDYSSNVTSMPAFQMTYDYQVNNWFSIGAAGSYQMMGVKVKNWSYYDESDNLVTEDFKTSLNRLNVAVRPLFHYGNMERFDMYSGLRIGYTKWNVSTTSTDPNYDALKLVKGGHVAFQLVMFGLRAYVTDNIGLNCELGLGGPHYFAVGLNVRL
jgi:opacity protein-like surface antigen